MMRAYQSRGAAAALLRWQGATGAAKLTPGVHEQQGHVSPPAGPTFTRSGSAHIQPSGVSQADPPGLQVARWAADAVWGLSRSVSCSDQFWVRAGWLPADDDYNDDDDDDATTWCSSFFRFLFILNGPVDAKADVVTFTCCLLVSLSRHVNKRRSSVPPSRLKLVVSTRQLHISRDKSVSRCKRLRQPENWNPCFPQPVKGSTLFQEETLTILGERWSHFPHVQGISGINFAGKRTEPTPSENTIFFLPDLRGKWLPTNPLMTPAWSWTSSWVRGFFTKLLCSCSSAECTVVQKERSVQRKVFLCSHFTHIHIYKSEHTLFLP